MLEKPCGLDVDVFRQQTPIRFDALLRYLKYLTINIFLVTIQVTFSSDNKKN